MSRSTNSFHFPDVNVWLAVTYEGHVHHSMASAWLSSVDDPIFFCRFTQLGLLRLLTNRQVMGRDVLTQREAWQAYHRWFEDDRVGFQGEPGATAFDKLFQTLSSGSESSTKLWADAYLAAFARTASLTVVTFDRALGAMPGLSSVLLSEPSAQ